MKGIEKNNGYSASIGAPRENKTYMIAIGELIAFVVNAWDSAGGGAGGVKVCPINDPYFLQEEIILEEYDRSANDGCGGVSLDYQRVVPLKNFFYIVSSSWNGGGGGWSWRKMFFLKIFDDKLPKLVRGVSRTRIEEVRGNQGKFIHVYEVDEKFFKNVSEELLSSKTFAEGCKIIESVVDPETAEKEKKKKFAQGQIEKLISMGFPRRDAVGIMKAAVPGGA